VELAARYGAKPAPTARGARSAPDRRQPTMLLPVTGGAKREGGPPAAPPSVPAPRRPKRAEPAWFYASTLTVRAWGRALS